jgi:tetratricopeptide (TPR) repeat protein
VLHRRATLIVLLAIMALVAAEAVAKPARNVAKPVPNNDYQTCTRVSSGALAACNRAIGSGKIKGPPVAALYVGRGLALSKEGQYDRAIADYDRAIEIAEKIVLPLAYNARGNAYSRKGDNERAIADYDQAIRLNPKLISAYIDRGTVYRANGDGSRAIADYDQAISLDPKLAVAYNGRGIAYRDVGDNDRAIADFGQALRLDPTLYFAHNNRGLAYLKLNELDRAIADYDAALKFDARQARSLFGRGVAKLKKGDAAGNADIAAAKALQGNIADMFARAGVVAPAAGSIPAPTPEPASTSAVAPLPVQKLQPALLAPVVLPQESVKTVFEKHNLLGIFAADCSKPASTQNYYYVHRLIDAGHLQRDIMDGPTSRAFVVIIKKAAESKPDEIAVSGTSDGKPFFSVYRIEPSGMRVLESMVDGKVEIAGGRFVSEGETPSTSQCGGAEASGR